LATGNEEPIKDSSFWENLKIKTEAREQRLPKGSRLAPKRGGLSFRNVICPELLPEFLPDDGRCIVGASILV
jgi:hypothetical protein